MLYAYTVDNAMVSYKIGWLHARLLGVDPIGMHTYIGSWLPVAFTSSVG
jgi:hypothetical protein